VEEADGVGHLLSPPIVENEGEHHLGSHRVQAVLKLRDDPEIPAPAPQSPQQVSSIHSSSTWSRKMPRYGPDPFFHQKVVVITGASSGIGRATALALAGRGVRLALGARRLSALEELAGEIQVLGGEALVLPVDVTRQEQVEGLVQASLSRWGQVDFLVSNAGQYIRAPISMLQVSDLERSMAVNFYGGVYAALAVLPHMLKRHSGQIVFVSSMDAKKSLPPDAPYAAAKYALSGFGEVLRQELYGTGVYVSIVYPGRVDTPMIADLECPPISAKISAQVAAKNILQALRRRQAEAVFPPQARLLYYLNVLSPRLADWAVRCFRLEGRAREAG
jgi:NADP-dependent 3-hydroxy acid dehydrogenase YdfG